MPKSKYANLISPPEDFHKKKYVKVYFNSLEFETVKEVFGKCISAKIRRLVMKYIDFIHKVKQSEAELFAEFQEDVFGLTCEE
ncbi:hypothetical protein [Candidatus Borrarchaeum sp.]|uniref:hypothetical protein n=1 Tax=Candidatus Borrarchaeum sp. TaxID=2846742 RepID=UPI00257F7D4D|nr:hypothetical protein [Candidatus Borrarchaeum sp.]